MRELVALRARPDLMPRVFSGAMQAAWPEFMQHDPAAQLYFGRRHLDAYPGSCTRAGGQGANR